MADDDSPPSVSTLVEEAHALFERSLPALLPRLETERRAIEREVDSMINATQGARPSPYVIREHGERIIQSLTQHAATSDEIREVGLLGLGNMEVVQDQVVIHHLLHAPQTDPVATHLGDTVVALDAANPALPQPCARVVPVVLTMPRSMFSGRR